MEISNEVEQEIISSVNRYVPKGWDKTLHLDRRKVMIKLVKKLISENTIPLNKIYILYFVKNWNAFLHSRSQYLN